MVFACYDYEVFISEEENYCIYLRFTYVHVGRGLRQLISSLIHPSQAIFGRRIVGISS